MLVSFRHPILEPKCHTELTYIDFLTVGTLVIIQGQSSPLPILSRTIPPSHPTPCYRFFPIGSVIHKSEANRGDKSRFIYTFHMIESPEHGAVYECVRFSPLPPPYPLRSLIDPLLCASDSEKNWLQPTPGKVGFERLFDEHA